MERRFWVGALSLGLLIIALLVVGGGFYLTQMQRSLWEQSVNNVLEVTEQGGKSFEVYMDQGDSMLKGRAAIFAQYPSSDTETIGMKLDLYEEGDPSFSVIDLTNKTMYYNSGESTEISTEQAEAYSALPEYGFLEPHLSMYTGHRVIGYYERFTFADGAQGMVIKTVPVSEVSDKFSLSFYDGAGFSYITNDNGDILLRSAGDNGNRTFSNVFDVVKLDDNSAEEIVKFRNGMADGKRGVMQLSFNGEEHIFAYVPISKTDGWYLISVIPDDVIMENANKMLMTTQVFVGVLVIALIIFISIILIVMQHRRQVRAKETEVLYREQLFDMLANNTDDVFIMLSSDGKTVQYISPNVERVMGVAEQDATQDLSCLHEVISVNGQWIERKTLLDTPLDGSITFEGSFIHPVTGDRRWFTETVYHTVLQSIERYIVVLADRTEDRQKEAALIEALQIAKVANESKSAFLSNMSHDIRTPMNAIVGLATLLQRDAHDEEKVRQHTRKITASSQHLLGLINDVLDMSKIESGNTSLSIGEFDLAELVDELGTIMRLQTNAKNQTFEIVVQDIKNEHLLGDKLRINQVMINILSNAVKYTPEGGKIVFTVQEIDKKAKNFAHVRFTVEDNGIGMSEEYLQHVFQPFTREIRTLVNQIQGTGLGMAITKSLIDLMGGSITVESTLGEGTTFIIDLELRIQEGGDDLTFWEDYGIKSALVVDDEEDICTGIIAAMANTGVNMQFALDGPTSVNMIRSAHEDGDDFDIILLDWKMPGMDGLETTRQIRSVVPNHIPIMIITSYDYEDIQLEGIEAGIDGFLAKPFFISNFKEAIRNVKIRRAAVVPEDAEKMGIAGRHFLYAEDNDLNAIILVELLSMEGATCDRVVDGKEAVQTFCAAPPGTYDAVLMDVQMPVMNGYEATQAIRASEHPEAASVPIIALTANAFAEDVRDALEAGMNAHIAKPVDMVRLAETLASLWG